MRCGVWLGTFLTVHGISFQEVVERAIEGLGSGDCKHSRGARGDHTVVNTHMVNPRFLGYNISQQICSPNLQMISNWWNS